MKRKILHIGIIALWIALIIAICFVIISLYSFITSENRSQKPLPEFAYESEIVVNKAQDLNCDIYLYIHSSHYHTKGFRRDFDFEAALNVNIDNEVFDVGVSSDTRIVHSSRESKQIPSIREEAWEVLNQSEIMNELNDFCSDVATTHRGDNAVLQDRYVIALFTFSVIGESNNSKGIFYIYEKKTKEIIYMATIKINDDYSFDTSSTSMTVKKFQIEADAE